MKYFHHKVKGAKDLALVIGDQRAERIIEKITPKPEEWKKAHYQELREMAYPPLGELADALVKMHSDDLQMVMAGHKQLQDYSKKCLAVKERWSK